MLCRRAHPASPPLPPCPRLQYESITTGKLPANWAEKLPKFTSEGEQPPRAHHCFRCAGLAAAVVFLPRSFCLCNAAAAAAAALLSLAP